MLRRLAIPAALLLAAAAAAPAGTAAAQRRPAPTADSAAIRRAALDYIEGWFTGDSVRMRRALHPNLAKRIVATPAEGPTRFSHTTADQLVRSTGQGGGREMPAERRQADVRILSLDDDMASVRLLSTELLDYMHLARVDGQWKIVNVLWDFRSDRQPAPAARPTPPAAGRGVPVSAAQFASLRWLEGGWRGIGGRYPAFFERYVFVNDSTIEVRHFTDSTLARESEQRGRIELRGGRVRYDRSVVTQLATDAVAFGPADGSPGGFAFRRTAPARWTATIEHGMKDGVPQRTVYEMTRLP